MKIGELRHFVDIYSEVEIGIDRYGDGMYAPQLTYQDVPAKIEVLSGREIINARQIVATCEYRVTVRFHNLNSKAYFLWKGKKLNIGHVNNIDGRDLTEVCLCSLGDND